MASAAFVAKNGLVGHQWEKNPLVLPRLNPLCRGISGWEGGVVGKGNALIEEGVGGWDRGLMHEKPGKGIHLKCK